MTTQQPTTPATGQIPQSPALAEAQVDSLEVLMSRDPEGYARQDLERIVVIMREQRERIAATTAATPVKAPRSSGPPASLKSNVGLGDLDL